MNRESIGKAYQHVLKRKTHEASFNIVYVVFPWCLIKPLIRQICAFQSLLNLAGISAEVIFSLCQILSFVVYICLFALWNME